MDKLLDLAAFGARETSLAQAVNSHNLANANTPGFRKDLALYSGPRVTSGLKTEVDLSVGQVQTTGNPLDVAINGEGYFVIEDGEGGLAYSRRGDFRVDADGFLTNGAGYRVLGQGGTINVPPYSEINVGEDGVISLRPIGAEANALAEVGRLQLVKTEPGQVLRKTPDGLLRSANALFESPEVKVVSGALEGSNVNVIDSLVTMIELARRFETQVKLMQSAEENRNSLNQIMKLE
jgi:flagellar basal-body rod protein FlgF